MTGKWSPVSRRLSVVALAVAASVLTASTPAAQTPGRVLGREEILLYGLGLRVEPSTQVVPKDLATIVSTYLQAPSDPGAQLPSFAPDAEIRATLRGPTFQTPVDLTTKPNSPFTIPPLSTPGLHSLDNIRLVSGGQVLLYGSPESVSIEVIEKLLVTQVTARPLTAAEIKERGLVFDKSSYQAYNFTAAFAIQDQPVAIDFPIVLPTIAGAQGVTDPGSMSLAPITAPNLRLPTLLPDTLKLQAQIPNLSVTGFVLRAPVSEDKQLIVPPIPGVIVIPGDIGFLNQFFSVMLMVANVAPLGSNLVVSDLQAEIVLPPGNDDVVGSADDPLRMASTADGEWPRIRVVAQAGPDGKLGNADDIVTLGPGETGHAEYLVEGRREGSAIVEMALSGTLTGLPIGPVTVTGRAAGAVLVRNPKFTLTFTHPEIVSAGEQYTLDATVTNTSTSPANFVSVNLYAANISGAALIGEGTREIEYIAPGDSATVSFTLVSKRSGRVTAATMDSDENVAGRFALKTAVGELGIPLSPDSLVLPKEAHALPPGVREAALGLLGKAHAVATAPPAALPKDVQRFTRKVVWDRAIEVAQAGMRVSLHEPVADSAAHLAMDFLGNNRARLAELHPRPDDRAFVANDVEGFDALRRSSIRGDTFAAAVSAVLSPEIGRLGLAAFHTGLAQKLAWRPGHISVLIGGAGGALPVRLTLIDSLGRRVTDATAGAGKVTKEIPYSDLLQFTDGSTVTGQLAVVASPDAGMFTIRLERQAAVPDTATFALSIVAPGADGTLRQYVFPAVNVADQPAALGAADDPFRFTFELLTDGAIVQGQPASAPPPTLVPDQAPEVLGVVQQADADLLKIGERIVGRPGRVVAVLFSEEVTPESAQDQKAAADITHYAPDGNAVTGVALQPGRRIAYLALRDPVGPLIARSIVMSDIADRTGNVLVSQVTPMQATVTEAGGVVTGQVLRSDGTSLAFANVRLFYEFTWLETESVPSVLYPGESEAIDVQKTASFGISSKTTDDQGRFSWDYVLAGTTVRIAAFNADTEEYQSVRVTVARDGQRLNVNLPFLGRGTLKGRTLAEDGTTPLAGTSVLVTSLTDQSQYYVVTDRTGAFEIPRIPVGNILIEAVNALAAATVTNSDRIPFTGAAVTRNIILLDVDLAPPVERGRVTGHVLMADGATVVAGVQVVAYYRVDSRYPVSCPEESPDECAVAVTRTDALGAFTFEQLPPGALRIYAFDQPTLMEGDVLVDLAPAGSVSFNLLLVGGLGTVQGTVVDSAGRPVADARVGGGLSLTTTDASGRFTLTDVPAGHRVLVAVSDALQTTGSAAIDIARPGETVSVTIVLNPSGTVTGVVRDALGMPVPNLEVYLLVKPLLFPGRDDNPVIVRSSTTTDADGRYRFERVVAGEYRVSAFNPDFTDGNVADVVLSYQGQVVTAAIGFRGRGHIHGVVYDADGHTPLRAAVGLSGDQLIIAGNRIGAGFVYIQNHHIVETSLADGAFTFNGVWVGPFTLRAAGQFSPDPIAYEGTMPPPGGEMNLTLRLRPTSEIRGTVLQPDGVTPVGGNVIVRYKSGAFVIKCIMVGSGEGAEEVCSPYPQGIQEETVVTDEHGRFWLPAVNAGSFTLTVEDPVGGKVGQTNGTIRAGEVAEVPVRLLGIGEVTVQVLASDASTPIPGARVKVNQVGFPGRSFEFIADSQGRVVFSGADTLTEGAFVVAATDLRDGFAGRAMGRVAQDGQQVLVRVFLYNASGSVAGIVYKAGGLDAAANVQVIVSNPHGPLAYTMTDAAGSFRVDTIPLGDFSIEAFNPASAGRAYGAGRIDLDRQEVAVNLTELAVSVVRGTAIDASTLEPLKGWTIELNQQSPSGRDLPTLVTTSGVDGGFSFPGATVGSFSLTVWYSQGGVYARSVVTGTLTRPAEAVDVVVPVDVPHRVYGRIEGVVVNPDGSPAGNSQVTIAAYTLWQTLITPVDGTFTIENVPVGRFWLSAAAQTTGNAGALTGDIQFEGQTAKVVVPLIGLSRISGTVAKADGNPAAGAEVVLEAYPFTGCVNALGAPVPCTVYTDVTGAFTFLDVPAQRFTVTASDPVTHLKGAAGGALAGGEARVVRVVLEPSAVVNGRALFSSGIPAPGIVAQLSRQAPWDSFTTQRLFVESRSDGVFEFPTAATGTWDFSLQDPVGSGLARRTVSVTGLLDLGDIVLDEAPPVVTGMTPAASSAGVPRDQVIRIVFSEPVSAATVSAATVVLSEPSGTVAGLVDLTAGDTTATFTPLAPLKDQTRYTIRVSGVKDRLDRTMSAEYVASFTTVDVKPPGWSVVSPAQGTSGVAVDSTVRVTFSEPIDVSRFGATPVRVSSAAGAVEGRIDYLNGNTTVVFSPRWPLADATVYRVQVDPAADLSGNLQAAGLDFEFRTTDRTPPVVDGLVAAHQATVIENGFVSITPTLGTGHDVSYVDYYANGVFTFTSRTAPFTFALQATPSFGKAGDVITVWAIAVDTSGNRGVASAPIQITILPDAPPSAEITAPSGGLSARNGDRVVVTVRATDDVGVAQVGYRASTGRPQDALARTITPASLERVESFEFVVPADLAPGAAIAIQASAADTKGQVANAAPVTIAVLDAVAPTVAITGATSGDRIRPGQSASVVVAAQDVGGVSGVTFLTSGLVSGTQTRTIEPAQNSVVTTFAVTAPASAQPGDVIRLDASATDKSGNTGNAARVLLAVADAVPPTIRMRTASGRLEMSGGQAVTLIVDADDETGVSRIDLAGQGAFQVADTQAVSPPSRSASARFTINVPADVAAGSTLSLQAKAFDVSGNASVPASLTLTTIVVADVNLPPSLVVLAGDTVDLTVQLPAPAPAGGMIVGLRSADPEVASVPGSVLFAEGEQSKTAVVAAASGGIVQIEALIQGVPRAATTVTVIGGVVRGTVFDPDLNPVVGAQVIVRPYSWSQPLTAETDANGRYAITGVVAAEYYDPVVSFTVTARDPTTQLMGHAAGQLNRPLGHATVNLVLLSAGMIRGSVRNADGTSAGENVRVDLYASGNLEQVLGTAFTDTLGAWEFALVSVGDYVADASDAAGNFGRSNAHVGASGEEIVVPITFLGRGAITGIVRDGAGSPVPNASVELRVNTGFGWTAPTTVSAGLDGRYRFEGVYVGTFTLTATDPVSGQGASATGAVTANLQEVSLDVSLKPAAHLQGTVFSADGTTPVGPGVTVIFDWCGSAGQYGCQMATTTDANGQYQLRYVPLVSFRLIVRDSATRRLGFASGTLSTSGETRTLNVTLLPQGTIIATVVGEGGVALAGASVHVDVSSGLVSDTLNGTSGADGQVIFQHVLAGNFTAIASLSGVTGTVTGTLAGGEIKQLTIPLEPSASLVGRVFEPDGTTSVASGLISIYREQYPHYSAQMAVSAGAFRFDVVKLGTYTVRVVDSKDRLRAIARGVSLATAGETVTRDLTLVGLGTVAGRVLNPDSSSASNIYVEVQSLTPDVGNQGSARTDAAGYYSVAEMVVGGVAVKAGDPDQNLLGEATGTLASHGETATVDILLASNAVNMPQSPYDANGVPYSVTATGALDYGTASIFHGDGATKRYGFRLDLVSGSTALPFTGGTIATQEDQGQEFAVRQDGLAGLNVVRKVYVPATGYFVRYLEILSNPSAAPITVGVRVSSYPKAYAAIEQVTATSSGDVRLSVGSSDAPDRWVTVDDVIDADPGVTYSSPALACVFDGPGAAIAATSATFAAGTVGELSYEWANITVPAGGRVMLMHFGSLQASRAAAQLSAERLAQLPPEALAGMSQAEWAAVANFAVPADGHSLLEPLPEMTGSVSGRVLASDGATPMSAAVYITSNHPLFAWRHGGYGNDGGSGWFYIDPASYGWRLPLVDFTLVARSAQDSKLLSSPATGQFAPGETTAVVDVVFSNMGVLRGTVRRHDGVVVTGGTVTITRSAPALSLQVGIGADGAYVFPSVPEGTFTLTASFSPSQGRAVVPSAPVSITTVAGQTLTVDVALVPTGALDVTLRHANGAFAVNCLIRLQNPSSGANVAWAYTDTSGRVAFTDVPVGAYSLFSQRPGTQAYIRMGVTIAQDQALALEVSYPAVGSLAIQVNYPSGAPVASSPVRVTRPSDQMTWGYYYTNSLGQYVLNNMPAGVYQVQASSPNWSLNTTVTAAIVTEAVAVTVPIFLPARAGVRVTALHDDGTPYAGLYVYLSDSVNAYFQQKGTTDAAGQAVLTNVGEGPFKVQLRDPNNGMALTEVAGTIVRADDGQTVDLVTQIVRFTGNLQGTVFMGDGTTPLASASVCARNAIDNVTIKCGSADAAGQYGITSVTPGTGGFTVAAIETSRHHFEGRVGGSFASNGDTRTIDVVVPIVKGTIEGYVMAGDGVTPVRDARVSLYDGTYPLTSTTTGPTGLYQFSNALVSTGGFTVQACASSLNCNGDYLSSQASSIPTSGGTASVSFTMPGRVGSIEGRVVIGDGVTPAGMTYVSALTTSGTGTEVEIARFETDATGAYRFSNLLAPDAGVLLRAYSPRYQSATKVERSVTVPSQGATVSGVDFVLPINKVIGHVRFSDGTPVPGPHVSARDAAGEEFSAHFTDAAGYFELYEVPAGSVSFVAADSSSGLSISRVVEVAALQLTTADFTLPPSNPVRVTVLGADGTPLPYTDLSLISAGLAADAWRRTDEHGVVSLDRVAIGPAYVQTCSWNYTINSNSCAAQAVEVEATGVPLEVTLDYRTAGTVAISVVGLTGQPVTDAWLGITAFGASGPAGSFGIRDLFSSANGVYQQAGVPPGPIRVVACDEQDHCGVASAEVVANATTDVTVTLGNAVSMSYALAGADGYQYTIDDDGSIWEGGIVSGGTSPYDRRHLELSINGSGIGYADAAPLELDGRQLVIGPLTARGVTVTRKVYVPAEGGFARYLDVLTNATNVTRLIRVTLDAPLERAMSWPVTPAESGDRYAVTQDDTGYAPAVVHVYNGTSTVPIRVVIGDTWSNGFTYSWTVTLPPGGSAALLLFTAQWFPVDAAGLEARAEALSSLTDPNALYGLTAGEKALIKNFVIK